MADHDASPDAAEPNPRRRFLKQAAVTGVAGGALWLAPSVVTSAPAFAVGTGCTTGGSVHWAAITPQGTPGQATLASGWVVGTFAGTVLRFQMADPNGRLIYTPDANFPQFDTGAQPTTTDSTFTGFFSMLMNHAAANDTATLTMTFSKKIKSLSFTIIGLTTGGNAGNGNAGNGTGYVDRTVLTAYNNFQNVGGVQATVPIVATPGSLVTATTASNVVTATGTAAPCSPCVSNNLTVTIAGPLDALTVDYVQLRNTTNGTFQFVGISDLTWSC